MLCKRTVLSNIRKRIFSLEMTKKDIEKAIVWARKNYQKAKIVTAKQFLEKHK